jgi:hypothetical protein
MPPIKKYDIPAEKASCTLVDLLTGIYTVSVCKKQYEYQAEIQKVPDIDGAYIEFPYDLKKEFGKGRLKVHAEFDGEPYDGSVVNMGIKHDDGSICYIIGILKDIRKKINKQTGDTISVRITEA